jgi:hypothetical protein
MNRARTSAIVLLLASAAAAYEQTDQVGQEEVRAVARVNALLRRPRLRERLEALHAWALGREPRLGRELSLTDGYATSRLARTLT